MMPINAVGPILEEGFQTNYSYAVRKNLSEMHFSPPEKARQRTFASVETRLARAKSSKEMRITVTDVMELWAENTSTE